MKNLSKSTLIMFAVALMSAVVSFVLCDFATASTISTAVFFVPILWECGSENMGGFEGKLLIYPDCQVLDKPILPKRTAATTLKDLVTATGSFIMKNGAKPIYVYCTDDTVGYKAENQGEVDGQSFKVSGEFFHPGNSTEVAAFSRQINNMRCHLVMQDREDKQIVVFNARIKPSCDLGKAPTDRRGYSFVYEANSFAPQIELATPVDMEAIISEEPAEEIPTEEIPTVTTYEWKDAEDVVLFTTTVTPLEVGVLASADGVFTLADDTVVTVTDGAIASIVPA